MLNAYYSYVDLVCGGVVLAHSEMKAMYPCDGGSTTATFLRPAILGPGLYSICASVICAIFCALEHAVVAGWCLCNCFDDPGLQ